MSTVTAQPATRLTWIAPQFLVDDLDRAIAYYCDKLGFELDIKYQSFYASVARDASPSISSARRTRAKTGSTGKRMSTWTPTFPYPVFERYSASWKSARLE